MESLKPKSGQDRRIKRGHPWVYSNEVDVGATPLKGVTPGAMVRVVDAGGGLIGHGHASPASLIAVRLLSRSDTLESDLIAQRLARALRWRERVYAQPFYRWVFGDGDGLPGLVVDRYGDSVVVQTSTWGMEAALDEVVGAIDVSIAPHSIIVKNNNSARTPEGLPAYVQLRRGEAAAVVLEHDASFEVNLVEGQKTGWFYDQRDNRIRLPAVYADARVLDLYRYAGAWGIHAARRGARRVVCVDSSTGAVAATTANAARNGVAGRLSAIRADVAEYLDAAKESFDVVVVDPPALVRRRKDLKNGVSLYRHLNRAALQRLAPGGLFVTCSCSAQLDMETFLGTVRAAARAARRELVLVGRGSMPADHPVHPLLTDTEYLKCLFLRAVD
jgi:23S rRNA (cytosine1962-C5)-methyltransferase